MTCALEHLGGCSGRFDPHHIVPRQVLRREFPLGAIKMTLKWRPIYRGMTVSARDETRSLDDLIADPANIVPCCRFHHERLENRRLYLEPPESAVRFAVELGLEHVLLKQKARAA